jgi:single-strand DNA-binding protein
MINKVTLVGFLGRDPEVRRLENDVTVAKFSLATTEYHNDANNELKPITEWHEIVVWRQLAEQAEKILRKGAFVYLEGKITHRQYTDKDGIERVVTEIIAMMFRSLDRKPDHTAATVSPILTMPETSES